MIEGSCHCGKVRWRLAETPARATACNCTLCRRYGGLWAYALEGVGAEVSGETRKYVWGDRMMESHFCGDCGCNTHAVTLEPNANGHRRLTINLRLAEPDAVAAIPVRHFDGCDSWADRPADGRTVADMWF